MNPSIRRWSVIAVLAVLPGCLSLRAYDGEKQGADAVAVVKGDYKIRAAPLSLLLRKVDGYVVDVRYSSVQVLPGVHTLLIDCQVAGAGASRHSIEAELEAGVKYRIVGDGGPDNRDCENVHLDALN